mmetsp:Transcript_32590/g.40958  ORF Transcript_32590/g.40958 Transcript_32590/m.40958 type:complete len:171 (-) Transcript_32590:93-605(-)
MDSLSVKKTRVLHMDLKQKKCLMHLSSGCNGSQALQLQKAHSQKLRKALSQIIKRIQLAGRTLKQNGRMIFRFQKFIKTVFIKKRGIIFLTGSLKCVLGNALKFLCSYLFDWINLWVCEIFCSHWKYLKYIAQYYSEFLDFTHVHVLKGKAKRGRRWQTKYTRHSCCPNL